MNQEKLRSLLSLTNYMSSTTTKESTAYERDPRIFLKSVDSSEMYKYTMKHALIGTGVGLASGGLFNSALKRFSPSFRRLGTLPIQSFWYVAGAAAGFTISSDWALVRYYRYHDRPEVSGFAKLATEKEQAELLRLSRMSTMQRMRDSAWEHRFKLIFAGWAGAMTFFIQKDARNKSLNTVHKFGHARIYAQAITIGALVLAFAFNE